MWLSVKIAVEIRTEFTLFPTRENKHALNTSHGQVALSKQIAKQAIRSRQSNLVFIKRLKTEQDRRILEMVLKKEKKKKKKNPTRLAQGFRRGKTLLSSYSNVAFHYVWNYLCMITP